LTTTDMPRGVAYPAIHDEWQDHPNLPLVTDTITNKRGRAQAERAIAARNASGRRFVDPTTCEGDYNQAETEFMKAMQLYKQASGRMFPTWSEVLEVLKGLGYEKVQPNRDRS
jgi:hypothetical protein